MHRAACPKRLSARVGTFNWPARYTDGGAEADQRLAQDLFREASVWGFQEAAWLPGRLPAGVAVHWAPDSTGKRMGQVLAWREGVWARLDTGSFLVSPATVIQQEAAGPTTHREKHVLWALLQHRYTGTIVRFGVVHLVPSKHLGGAALDLWKLQRDGVRRWMQLSPEPVVVLGDFNGEPGDRVARPLIDDAAGVLTGPSHGARSIDWIIYGEPLTGGEARVLPDTKQSDHRPVMGTIRTP